MTILGMPVRRLRSGFIVLISVPLAVFAVFIGAASVLQRESIGATNLAEHSNLVLLGTERLATLLAKADWLRGDVRTVPDDLGPAAEASLAIKTIPAQLATLGTMVRDNPSQEAKLQQLSVLALRSVDLERRLLLQNGLSGKPEAASLDAAFRRNSPVLRQALLDFTLEEQRLQTMGDAAQRAMWLRTDVLVLAAAVLACVTIIFGNLSFGKQIVQGLERVACNANTLAAGEFAQAPMGGLDEIAQLDRTFHEMAARLRNRRITVQAYALVAKRTHDIVLFFRQSDMRVIEANAAAVAEYGYTADEMLQLTAYDISATPVADLKAHVATLGKTDRITQTIHRRKDGTRFPVEAASQAATLDGERIVVSVIRERTEVAQLANFHAEAV